jgi:hypothetical protein
MRHLLVSLLSLIRKEGDDNLARLSLLALKNVPDTDTIDGSVVAARVAEAESAARGHSVKTANTVRACMHRGVACECMQGIYAVEGSAC